MHLFAGAGGGLLADLILGHEPIVAVEWDAYCCAVLREQAADGWFPNLHVWEGDVRLFDPSEYAGRVDCIHAGFPCQDLSIAGPKRGIGEGTRSGLYREVLRISGLVRPRYIFMENSPAILANTLLGTVLRDVATLGYDARWTCLPASFVGAPHGRDRWWCLATLPNANGTRESQQEGSQQNERRWVGNVCETLPYAHGLHVQGKQSQCAYTEGGGIKGNGSVGSLCDGVGWWTVEPNVGRVVDGMAARAHRIKALGNGQVPIQAALAWMMLGGPVIWG